MPTPIPFHIIDAPRREASREAVAHAGERRPDFAAESMTFWSRLGLLALTLSWSLVIPVAVIAANWDGSSQVVESTIHVALAAFAGVGALLLLVFGALLGNNRAVPRARIWWAMAIALTGPVGMLGYWIAHVFPARYVPRRSGN
jgi:hypothetical protein